VGARFLDDVEKAREKQVSGGELSDARFSQGVGLGLPLSYNIVHSLGGELCYTSEVGPQTPAPGAWSMSK
jgi:signal transduction histidine kinase